LDLGCGPGFFSVEMAEMVGASGKVIAVDMQEGMLRKLESKIQGTEIENELNCMYVFSYQIRYQAP